MLLPDRTYGISFVRLLLLKPFYLNFTKILNHSNVLIIGGGKMAKLLAEKMLFENFYGVKVVGFLDDNLELGENVLNGINCALEKLTMSKM